MRPRGRQEEDVNSVHDECHVSNRHMTWWHNARWIRVDNGPHMRMRQGTAQNLASSQASGRTGPRRKQGRRDLEGRKRETEKGEREEERQHRKSNEATLHLILHVSQQQATATPATTANSHSNSRSSNHRRNSSSNIPKSEASALIEPSATVGMDLNSAAIHDVSYDSLSNASEFNAFLTVVGRLCERVRTAKLLTAAPRAACSGQD